jgi:hypothetical protein
MKQGGRVVARGRDVRADAPSRREPIVDSDEKNVQMEAPAGAATD